MPWSYNPIYTKLIGKNIILFIFIDIKLADLWQKTSQKYLCPE